MIKHRQTDSTDLHMMAYWCHEMVYIDYDVTISIHLKFIRNLIFLLAGDLELREGFDD